MGGMSQTCITSREEIKETQSHEHFGASSNCLSNILFPLTNQSKAGGNTSQSGIVV